MMKEIFKGIFTTQIIRLMVGMNLLKSYISDSIAFPNFRVSTIDGEKIELKDSNRKTCDS